jgi:hypothetical protein
MLTLLGHPLRELNATWSSPIMLTDTLDAHIVRHLLENLELKIVLDSPDDDYRFEYFTTFLNDRQTGEPRLIRTYRLHDLIRRGVTPEPWDTYDLDKQVTLITNLMRFSHYRVAKIVCGWEVACSACGHVMCGKHWETSPKTCTAQSPRICRARIDNKCLVEIPFAEG